MKPFKQNEFGKRVAADFFLSGTGSSMYIVYFLSALIAGFKLNSAILLAGPALILAGLVLLFSELGKPSNFWRSVANYRTSWMARGAIFNFFYVAAGFGILLAESLRSYSFLAWIDATGFVIALLVLVYPGMLLRAIKDIPAWNSASTLAVTLIFALSGGGAAVILASVFIQPQALPEELVAVMVLNAFLIISGELYLKALRSLGSKKEGADLSYKEIQKKGGVRILMFLDMIFLVLYIIAFFSAGGLQYVIAFAGSMLTLYTAYLFRVRLLEAGYHQPLITKKFIDSLKNKA
jgi:formate-dependent nitrite reductase membrane component NrfD